MKLSNEGIFDAKITSQSWEFSATGKPICKLGFATDAGDITGSFFFDEDAPKFGKETGLEKNSRAFAAAIPGWSPAAMDRAQTYIGQQVTIEAKYNAAGYLNVKGIYPLGSSGGGIKMDTAGDAMAKLRAAAAKVAEGVTPPPAPAPQNDFPDDKIAF